MAKKKFELDDNLLRIASEYLGTSTAQETVTTALEHVASSAAALAWIETDASFDFSVLSDPNVTTPSWRRNPVLPS